MKSLAPFLILPLLAACGQSPDAPEDPQRISLEQARHRTTEPLPSPDTETARWVVSGDGQAVTFGQPEMPMLTLACNLGETPAKLTIIRHVEALPGQKALFPVIGNGTISRFSLDAVLHEGEWRWEGALKATDPLLEAFTGSHSLEATLPGGGSLQIDGSRIPGEFINWCRAGGRVKRAEAIEKAAEALATPAPKASPAQPNR